MVRHWKSLASIKHPFSHEKQSPRGKAVHSEKISALKSSDEIELHRIFAIASLPEDHPDALKFAGRKPSVDETIVCSPSFTNKLRRQLSRKSLASGMHGSRYARLEKRSTGTKHQPSFALETHEESSPDLLSAHGTDLGGYDLDALCLDINEARLGAFFLDNAVLDELDRGSGYAGGDYMDYYFGRCEPLPSQVEVRPPYRSFSAPNASSLQNQIQRMRRSRSTSDLEGIKYLLEVLPVSRPQPTFFGLHGSWRLSSLDSGTPSSPRSSTLTTVRGQQTMDVTTRCAPSIHFSPLRSSDTTACPRTPVLSALPKNRSQSEIQAAEISGRLSSDSLHLYNMQISHHLRSQSQLSETSSLDIPGKVWSQNLVNHASLNGLLLSSADLYHRRQMSGSGLASSAVPSLWGKVIEDGSSSVYSSRPSTSTDPLRPSTIEIPYSIPHDDIRGQYSSSRETSKLQKSDHRGVQTVVAENSNPSLPVVPATSLMIPSSEFAGAMTMERSAGSRHEEGSSLAKSSSSGSLGKLSKFTEDLVVPSPDKPTKKRRSMLRMFFSRLSKSKLRSVSTPLLWNKSGAPAMCCDGPSDDPDTLLQVPRSTSGTHASRRSVSFTSTVNEQPGDATSNSSRAAPSATQRRQSPAEYERSLSVVGDDRRRRSTIHVPTPQEPERVEQSETFDHTLHRAAPLFGKGKKGAENVLMERALHIHQAEKAALFRSNSKRFDTAPGSTTNLPVFNIPFVTSASSTPVRMPTMADELDPFDTTGLMGARRSQSMQHLRPPGGRFARADAFGKKLSNTSTTSTSSTNATKGRLRAATPLASWSRFPSHTRRKRSGSAGGRDNVVARDFAYAAEAIGIGEPGSSESGNTTKKSSYPHLSASRRKPWLVKSRSMTFGNVMRYYSNLFSSSTARNRRSSIAIGGKLEHPELEMLPPIFPAHAHNLATPTHGHSRAHLAHLVDNIKDEIREEGHHLAEGSQHLKNETQEAITRLSLHNHRHYQQSESPKDSEVSNSSNNSGASSDILGSSESGETPSSAQRRQAIAQQPFNFDGTSEQQSTESDRSPTARRLSRMYQAYVQLPKSMDTNAVAEDEDEGYSDRTNETTQLVDSTTLDALEGRLNEELGRFLTVPSPQTARRSPSPRVRRFPSVTVVDDRKGHWRSVSLISVQSGTSGKSLRNSTKNLLDLLKETENTEREKLIRAAEDFGKEIGIAV